MLQEIRHSKIKEIIYNEKFVEVPRLAKLLDVAEITIRRDLDELAKTGVIKRTHGGAIITEENVVELPYTIKKDAQKDEKERIGIKAIEFISENDTIILDSGTTTLQIAKNLKNKKGLTVMTNGIEILEGLNGKDEYTIISTGGILRHKSMSLIGPIAERAVREFRANTLFLGIYAIDIETGITSSSHFEASIEKTMMESSKEIIGVVDHSKFGKTDSYLVCPVSSMHKIITDAKTPEKYINNLKEKGVEVILV
jgi:DeoR/GlpR family transcriptional regulator of sugar metabolism